MSKDHIVAWLVEGKDHNEKVIAHNVFIDREDAIELGKSFVGHYPSVHITPLERYDYEFHHGSDKEGGAQCSAPT